MFEGKRIRLQQQRVAVEISHDGPLSILITNIGGHILAIYFHTIAVLG